MSITNHTHNAMNAANAVGQAGLMNAASSIGLAGAALNSGILSANTFPSAMVERSKSYRVNDSQTVFHANIEVLKVANGYLINIGRTEGYKIETHIATTVEEVNAIIMAQMVAFRLEDGK